MRRSSSPSPSSWLAVAMAPCSASSTASQPSATAPVIASTKVSKARSSTRPLGGAPPAIGIRISAPASRATWISPPSVVLVPSKRASAAWVPSAGPARPVPIANASSGVGIGEKVLVSCIISASTKRIGRPSFSIAQRPVRRIAWIAASSAPRKRARSCLVNGRPPPLISPASRNAVSRLRSASTAPIVSWPRTTGRRARSPARRARRSARRAARRP